VQSTPIPENKGVNKTFNQVMGQSVNNLFGNSDDPKANGVLAPRIDGRFTGTTAEILRWAACKWGIDEYMVDAQAAVESWWRQTNLGDWGTDPTACPPGHGLGVDGKAGRCPESYGILQNRYRGEKSSWPGIGRSTAMNADTAYAIWRACYEGYELWLNNVERVGQYAAGDAWGCIGRWFAGRWHTDPSERYIAKVKDYLSQRIWQEANFQEP
jgi:autotransporter family porin